MTHCSSGFTPGILKKVLLERQRWANQSIAGYPQSWPQWDRKIYGHWHPHLHQLCGNRLLWGSKGSSHQCRAQAGQGCSRRDEGVRPACAAAGQCHSDPGSLPSCLSPVPQLGFEFPTAGHPCYVPTAHIPGVFPPGAGVCQHVPLCHCRVPQPPPTTLQTLVRPGGPCPALPFSPGGGWSAGTPLAGTLCSGPGGLLAQAEDRESQGGPGQTLHAAPAPSQQRHFQASTGLRVPLGRAEGPVPSCSHSSP